MAPIAGLHQRLRAHKAQQMKPIFIRKCVIQLGKKSGPVSWQRLQTSRGGAGACICIIEIKQACRAVITMKRCLKMGWRWSDTTG